MNHKYWYRPSLSPVQHRTFIFFIFLLNSNIFPVELHLLMVLNVSVSGKTQELFVPKPCRGQNSRAQFNNLSKWSATQGIRVFSCAHLFLSCWKTASPLHYKAFTLLLMLGCRTGARGRSFDTVEDQSCLKLLVGYEVRPIKGCKASERPLCTCWKIVW